MHDCPWDRRLIGTMERGGRANRDRFLSFVDGLENRNIGANATRSSLWCDRLKDVLHGKNANDGQARTAWSMQIEA